MHSKYKAASVVGDVTYTPREAALAEYLVMDRETYGCVKSVCYLGDTLGREGGIYLATTHIIRK